MKFTKFSARIGAKLKEPGEPVEPVEAAESGKIFKATPADCYNSCYSPIPKHPVNREENDTLDAAVVSGAPVELQARTVRIFKPSKPATQSGNWNGRHWRMDWDVLPRGHRWENPLMGWQSSGDFMQGTHLNFKTKEDAIHFAEKQGMYPTTGRGKGKEEEGRTG